MKILSSILIASVLVMGVLAVIPAQQAYAGHIVTANSLGSGTTGIDITAAGVISDIDAGTVIIADDLTIQDATPLITLDDTDNANDGSILADNGVVTIDANTSSTTSGQVVILADTVIGTAGADLFEWSTAGGDTFSIGTNVAVDTMNFGGAGVDILNVGTSDDQIGFFGTTAIVRVAAYTTTNLTIDRVLDADLDTVLLASDVLGTLIEDLKLYGLLQ